MEKETSELPAIAEAAFPVRITAKAGAALGLSALAALAILSTEDPIAVGAIVLMLLLLVLLLCLTVQLSRQIHSTVELDPEKKRTMEKETSELPAIAEAAFPVRITAKAGAALGLSALAALAILSTEDPIAVGAIVLMLLLLVLLLCLTVQLSRQIQ
ncbi:UNVERIFIED_CONTAM: hypothetical protein FKN15_071718 [Acipenser sinensis]